MKNKIIGQIDDNPTNIYKKNADMYFADFTNNKIMASNIIPHFYQWDTNFKKIDTIEKFSKILDIFKSKGVKWIVETDFSVWYEFPEQAAKNKRLNSEYRQILIKYGFNIITNFNTITEVGDIQEKNSKYCCYDFNHRQNQYAQRETYLMSELIKQKSLARVFVMTSKKKMPKEYEDFFKLPTRYEFIPVSHSYLRIKKERYYGTR